MLSHTRYQQLRDLAESRTIDSEEDRGGFTQQPRSVAEMKTFLDDPSQRNLPDNAHWAINWDDLVERHFVDQIAGDPSTSGAVLTKIVDSGEVVFETRYHWSPSLKQNFSRDSVDFVQGDVLPHILENPGLPPTLAKRIIGGARGDRALIYFQCFLENPVVPLLLMEDPNFLSELMGSTLYVTGDRILQSGPIMKLVGAKVATLTFEQQGDMRKPYTLQSVGRVELFKNGWVLVFQRHLRRNPSDWRLYRDLNDFERHVHFTKEELIKNSDQYLNKQLHLFAPELNIENKQWTSFKQRALVEFAINYEMLAEIFIKRYQNRLWDEYDELVAQYAKALTKHDPRIDPEDFKEAVATLWEHQNG